MAETTQNVNEAQLSLDLFRDYNNSARQDWANNVREDEQFRHNVQWTRAQKKTLELRGHSAVAINQIDPAIEAAKAIMTSRRPGWSVVGREDTDVKMAKVVEHLLEYTYDISNGEMVMANGVEDYLTKSMLVALVYYDKNANYGKGRVKFVDVDPLEVFIDPASRRRDCEDAENILIVKELTLEQAIRYMPDKEGVIRSAMSSHESIYPSPDREALEGQVFPGDVDSPSDTDNRLLIERYTKKPITVQHVVERFGGGGEYAYMPDELSEYLQKTYAVFNNVVIPAEDEQSIQQLVANIDPAMYDQIQELSGADLVGMGMINITPVEVVCTFRYISAGDKLLSEEAMNINEYPVKFAMNKWNRTPYPSSDVRFSKGINQYINKGNSLLLAHATRTTNVPLLVPRGSGNIKTIREEYLKPDAVIEFNPEFGTPFTPTSLPMATEMFAQLDRWKRDIQYQFGIPELMHGFTSESPQTFRGTMAMEEYGQRKIKCKLRDIENALSGMGRVAFKLMQKYYTEEEIIRIVQPSGQVSESRINYMGVDEYSTEIKKLNDISVADVDIRTLGGSTLPSNRWAQFDYYMQLADRGYIDQVEVLKKTELVDVDGVLERTSRMKQLENVVMQQEEEIKRLRGDLQTAERESTHDRKRVEIEKFKTGLKDIESQAKAASTVFDARLGDELGNIKTEVREQNKSVAEQSKRRKENKNGR